jgi:hypothetical protein
VPDGRSSNGVRPGITKPIKAPMNWRKNLGNFKRGESECFFPMFFLWISANPKD